MIERFLAQARRLSQATPAQYRLHLEAARTLVWVLPCLRLFGYRWVMQRCQSITAPHLPPNAASPAQVARAVARLLRCQPVRGTCLAEAVTVAHLLARRGIASQICFGAVIDPGQRLRAHAWVEHEGHALNAARTVAQHYPPLRPVAR